MKTVKIFGKSIPLLAIVIIAIIGLVTASVIIYSNIVTVHVIPGPAVYVLTLEAPDTVYVNEPITFTGFLTVDGAPIEDATITITRISPDGPNDIGSATTIADGSFTLSWIPTTINNYQFKAFYVVPA